MPQRNRATFRCANCDIRITWQPTYGDKGMAYCCPGCAEGGPCCCDYDNLPRSDSQYPHPIGRRGCRATTPD